MKRRIDWPVTLTLWALLAVLCVFWWYVGGWLLELLRRLVSPA